jgi:EmrB/QacA subfamily drug resistance transporter
VAALAAFMATLDSSIVNVALPTLAVEFRADVKVVAWVVQSYLLTTMALLLVGGRLLDLLGERRLFAAGFAIYTAGSALCALSISIHMLIAARAFQGMGAAVLMSSNQGLVARSFPPGLRGRALGLVGTVVSVGLASGPPLGGLLISSLGWRSIFYLNVPIGIAAVIYSLRIFDPLPAAGSAGREKDRGFDWPGAVLIAAGLSSLFVALDLAVDRAWTDGAVIVLVAASLAILGVFLAHEKRSACPLLDLTLFTSRFFTQSCLAAFLVFASMISAMILMPFYLQNVLGFAPGKVGLVMTAVPVAMLLAAPLAGWLSDLIGPRIPATSGLALVGAGLLLLSGLDADFSVPRILWRLGLIGVGMGFFGSPNSNAILSSVPGRSVGSASGLAALMRTAGIAFGIAFSATAFTYFRNQAALEAAGLGREGFELERTLYLEGIVPVFGLAAAVVAVNIVNSMTRGRLPAAPSPGAGERGELEES